jgi:hypothetical protein
MAIGQHDKSKVFLHTAATSNGNGTTLDVLQAAQMRLHVVVTGTFDGTITFQESLDDYNATSLDWVEVALIELSDWATASSTFTGSDNKGYLYPARAARAFRAVISEQSTGTVDVTAIRFKSGM